MMTHNSRSFPMTVSIFLACWLMFPAAAVAQEIENRPIETRVQGQALIAENPLDPAAYIRFSRFLVAEGDLKAAEELLEVGRNKANRSANLLVELSEIYEVQDRLSQAEAVARDAVETDPESMEARIRMGEAHCRMGAHKKGLKSFEVAVKLSEGEALPRVRYIQCLLDNEEPLQAEDFCLQSIAADPDNPDLWLSMGEIFEKQGKNREAFTTYGQVLTLDAGRADAYARQGRLFCRFGQFDSAEQACRKALALEPGNMLAHAYLGIACSRLGNGADARKHAQIAESSGLNMGAVWEKLGK